MAASGASRGPTPRQVAAVVCGNALEFYDFVTYSFFAAQIGRALFPGNADEKLILSLATFGIGFITRLQNDANCASKTGIWSGEVTSVVRAA